MATIANLSKMGISTMTDITDATPATTGASPTTGTSGYEAVTFTNVENVVSIPEMDGTRSSIPFNSVTDGQTQLTGNIARVAAQFDVADNPDDAGQTILRNAFQTGVILSMEIQLTSGLNLYCQGTVAKAAISGVFDGVVNRQFIFNVLGDVRELARSGAPVERKTT